MHITTKELRKMMNKAWLVSRKRVITGGFLGLQINMEDARYRDVSKIIKEAEKAKEVNNG